MRKLTLIVLLLAAATGIYLVVENYPAKAAPATAAASAPAIVVAAVTVEEQVWQPTIKATGSLRAWQGVKVTAQESGLITAIHFESGRHVKKGDLLLQQYDQNERLQLKSVKAELGLARKNFDRSRDLVGKKAVSQSQLDTVESDLERLSAQVENLEASISRRAIRAPFDGILGIRRINIGQYIEPGDDIVTLEALDPIFVEFSLPQSHLTQAQIGQAVRVETDAYPGAGFTGQINAIEPRIDPSTRSFQVEAEIPNADLQLRPGMFVTTHLMLPADQRVLTLPQAAITYNPYGDAVFVIESAPPGGQNALIAKTVYVTLGETRGDQVAILAGLKPGDRVVTAGQLRLRNGSPVVIDDKVVVGNSAAPSVDEG